MSPSKPNLKVSGQKSPKATADRRRHFLDAGLVFCFAWLGAMTADGQVFLSASIGGRGVTGSGRFIEAAAVYHDQMQIPIVERQPFDTLGIFVGRNGDIHALVRGATLWGNSEYSAAAVGQVDMKWQDTMSLVWRGPAGGPLTPPAMATIHFDVDEPTNPSCHGRIVVPTAYGTGADIDPNNGNVIPRMGRNYAETYGFFRQYDSQGGIRSGASTSASSQVDPILFRSIDAGVYFDNSSPQRVEWGLSVYAFAQCGSALAEYDIHPTSITLPDGSTPEENGYEVVFASGLMSPNAINFTVNDISGAEGPVLQSQTQHTVVTSAAAVNKSGSGTLVLDGINTFTSTLNCTDGTVILSPQGSLDPASSLAIGKGAVFQSIGRANTFADVRVDGLLDAVGGSVTVTGSLAGVGIIAGDVTVVGSHNPGNSPGVQTITGNLVYEKAGGDGPIVNWELSANTMADTPVTHDGVSVGGDLIFADLTSVRLSFDWEGSTVDWTNPFWDSDERWTVYSVAGNTTGFQFLSLLGADWKDGLSQSLSSVHADARFSLARSGSDIVLNYSVAPVPEPGNWMAAVGALGILGLRKLWWRRTTA